ncbi:hypothetical protein BDQ17DRAFT_1427856 [Cyathus striatus]|nr:hypothetical protein BDQ17DRAFT_1427856 [Cyathus striatus]
MVHSSPLMANLSLPLGKFSSPVDLQTLQIIADSCPDLEYLQIAILIGDDETIILRYSGGTHPLRTLSVGSSSGSVPMAEEDTTVDTVKLARFIDMTFPQLESIITHTGQADNIWMKTWEFVRLCHEVRGDERMRLGVNRCTFAKI